MYFIIAVNIWIDIKIVILHHDGTPFVVLGHASVLYLQYGIKYKKVGEDHYTVGYSSYYLDYVIDWLNNCFEFCGESKIVVNVGKDTNVPSNDGWIPVEERLPEDCEEIVLVQVSGKPADNILFDNAFEFALYEKEEGWMLDNYPEWKNPDVIAWQPLPEPYRRFKKELS